LASLSRPLIQNWIAGTGDRPHEMEALAWTNASTDRTIGFSDTTTARITE
jgi:hypothetical protein